MYWGEDLDERLYEGIEETQIEGVEPIRAGLPITHWSYSSLMCFLRNPLAWYKRYVEKVYDTPSSPAGIIGRAAHVALQHFYGLPVRDRTQTGGIAKGGAIDLGLEYLRNVPDFEVNFGKAKTKREKKEKRASMEREYLQAIGFYLEKPPKYNVVAIEEKSTIKVDGLKLPIRAISDLVVRSAVDKKALDIVDHKFVDSFSSLGGQKTLFIIQAIFNYYTVQNTHGKPVRRFILQECRKRRNADGKSQMRRYIIEYAKCKEEFAIFHRLIRDATAEIARERLYLPNPSDMFEGENSFDIYKLGLAG
ncbi:MAG: hypothetical protein G01um10148_911 [Parcubacteria group bacterium Gr01-1014_8]|nr:MAG: hypothetical protein G01um10148_911 [Parcubacteria group bacterium Gr01-1014_8]